jgi:Zn-dependent peptidase ImmA (M78 family)
MRDVINMSDILYKIKDEEEKSIYQRFITTMPFDVVGFCKALKIDIKESKELPAKISGFIKQIDNKVSICVNHFDSLNRKRFTVAHELGHYFCHRDELIEGIVDGVDTLNRDGKIDPMEIEANNFAANILMPEEIFTALWIEKKCSIPYMSEYFFVSESAIITRARFLGLANDYSGYFG